MDPIELLNKNKLAILNELVLGHSDPQRARVLVEQFIATESALAKMERPRGKYAGVKKVRDAIKEVLENSGRPLTEDYIKDEIVNRGGFRRGEAGITGARLIVQKSIKHHLPGGQGYTKLKLKKHNGLVGLEGWPDAKFANEEGERLRPTLIR